MTTPLDPQDVLRVLLPVLKEIGVSGKEGVTYEIDDSGCVKDGKCIVVSPVSYEPILIDQDISGEPEDAKLYWWPMVSSYDPGDRDTPSSIEYNLMEGADKPLHIYDLVYLVALHIAKRKIQNEIDVIRELDQPCYMD